MENNIYTELNRIQKELKATKDKYNAFGKYNYRSCESILEAVKQIQGDCITTLSDSIINVGNANYVEATASIMFNGVAVSVKASAREATEQKGMNDAQITGSTSSYARKYALSGLFAIDDNKDAEDLNKHGKDTENKSITQEQIAELKKLGVDEARMCVKFNVSNINDMTFNQAQQAIALKTATNTFPDAKVSIKKVGE